MLISTNSRKKGDEMPDYLRLEAFRTTPLVKQPFEHLIVSGFIGPAALAAINADYPAISSPGSFPVDQVSFGPAFQTLLDELESDQFRDAFEQKIGHRSVRPADRDHGPRPMRSERRPDPHRFD